MTSPAKQEKGEVRVGRSRSIAGRREVKVSKRWIPLPLRHTVSCVGKQVRIPVLRIAAGELDRKFQEHVVAGIGSGLHLR